MTDAKEWRPKVGERVAIYGEISHLNVNASMAKVIFDSGDYEWIVPKDLSPLPASPEPRAPWVVLREAADLVPHLGSTCGSLREEADRLKAAAAPKPPSLAEAVRAYYSKVQEGEGDALLEYNAMVQALAREEDK